MKKLCFISSIASPHQVRFERYLQKYYDTYFFFLDQIGNRQSWWKVDLGDRCKVLPCWFKWHFKYFTFSPLKYLKMIKPDIVMVGGFSTPTSYICYLWARMHGCKTVVQTERSRRRDGRLRGYGIVWRILHFLYRKVDMVMCTDADIVPQFRDTFRFGDKVVAGQYPSDIDKYFKHTRRTPKESRTLIFANRLTDIYDPLMAIEIFVQVHARHPRVTLMMNASGELRSEVEGAVRANGIGDSVTFLDEIRQWDALDAVYQKCDIMFLPAKSSNGNYTLTEAMCSGMAIVVSDKVRGSLPVLLRNHGTGFVVSHAVKPFVEAICWIIENPEFYDKITDENRALMRPYTLESTARLYASLFEAIEK